MINLRIRECYLFRTLYWIFLKISLYVIILGYYIILMKKIVVSFTIGKKNIE